MKWLELNDQNMVVNVVVWDGISPYVPTGISQILPCSEHEGVWIGWRLVAGEWIAPNEE